MIAYKKFLPYLISSLFVIVFWKLFTSSNNYAFNPKGKELLMLQLALNYIFLNKTIFWLILVNVIVYTVMQLSKKNFTIALVTLPLAIIYYLLIGQILGNKCAPEYYTVFINQSTTEKLMTKPIIRAGYYIGPILTKDIENKEMKYRRYAIEGLKKIKYKPATPTLKKILFDKTDLDYIRADALETLISFNTSESTKIIQEFRNIAIDPDDRKVFDLVDEWASTKYGSH
jgi:hypothetical protein